MDFRESKLEFLVMAGAMALLFGVLGVFRGLKTSSHIETKDIVYEMPRPVSSDLESEFELGDREIIRKKIALEKKDAAKIDKNKQVKAPPIKGQRPQRAQKKLSTTKKPKFSMRVVDRDESERSSDEDLRMTPPGYNNPYQAARKAEENKPEGDDEDDKNKMSYEEWLSLLKSQPTQENVSKLLLALKNKEIEYKDFYRLVQELMIMKDNEHQAAALFAVQVVPNVLSFAMVAKHLDNLTPENRTIGSNILLSYTQPNRLSILAQALSVNDFVVVKRAAEAITVGLEKAKSGQPVTDPRFARGNDPTASASPTEPFSRFVPIFQQWRQSGDSNLVGLADSFLSQWQG